MRTTIQLGEQPPFLTPLEGLYMAQVDDRMPVDSEKIIGQNIMPTLLPASGSA